jgi:hypothetical protein
MLDMFYYRWDFVLEHLAKSLIEWFGEYNQNYLHSKLHYKSPMEFEAEFKRNFAENTL